MGIFSSKRKTYVGSSSSRLVEDALVPNSIISGTTRAILKDGDIALNVITDLSKGLGTKARSMFNFGKNNYIFGTPDAQLHTTSVGSAEIRAVLEGLHPGQTVVLSYNHFCAPNILHIGWFKLMRDHGYDPVTNKLGALTLSIGYDVFLHDLVVVVPQARAALYDQAATAQWGTPAKAGPSPTRPAMSISAGLANLAYPSAVEQSTTATEDHVRVQYAWTSTAGAVQQASFTIGNDEYDEAGDYFQVSYTLDGALRYWIYKPGDGTHPTLDELGDTETMGQTVGNFFPFIHFRNNKQSMAASPTSAEFLDSKKMAKKLGIDYMQVHDAIHENPDIADVAQAYIGMFVEAVSTNELDQRYLFEFFDGLRSAEVGVPSPSMAGFIPLANQMQPRTAVQVQDTKVKHTLTTTGISKRLVAGTLPEGKAYASGYVGTPTQERHHFFRRRLTPSTYEEIQVYGLEMRYWIDGQYSSVGDEEDATLLIPVDYSITRNFPLQLQEKIYARSLRLICNSSVTVKIKWYQRGAFGTFLKIVGIAMVLYDGGLTLALVEGGLSTAAAVLVTVLVTTVVQIGVDAVFKFLAKTLGSELALLAALAMVSYGGFQAFTQGIKNALPEIRVLLQVATGLINGATRVVLDDLVGLQTEFSEFEKEKDSKLALLEETKALLESSARLNPLVIFGETPENYFNRTVHSGNVGTIGYLAIESYVDMALTLPKLSNTLGGVEYAL